MRDLACAYCGQRITEPTAVAWHGRDAYHHDGCHPAAETDREGNPRTVAHRQLIDARDRHHQDGECKIDGDAMVSQGDDGAYVQAWVWVPSEHTEPA